MELVINSDRSLVEAIEKLTSDYNEKKYVKLKLSYGRQRSQTQNKALHKYCQNLADQLNSSGLDMKKVIKQDVDIPWTMDAVKTYLWKPIQKAVTGLDSTTKPERSQYSDIYEVLNRHLGQKFGISVQWPSRDY